MITKTKAKLWVLDLTIHSLNNKARSLKTGDVGGEITQKDLVKVQNELRELADQLGEKKQKLLTRQRLKEEKKHEGRSSGSSATGGGTGTPD